MKKIITTSLFILGCYFANAKTNDLKVKLQLTSTTSFTYCAIASGTITNTDTGESITVYCTKCNEVGSAEAKAAALLCVNAVLKAAINQI